MADPIFLLDSNIAIYILGDAHCPAAERLQQCEVGSAVTSVIVYSEVMRGLSGRTPDVIAKAQRLFDIVTVMPFDRRSAEYYAALPFRRRSFDRLIGAHALSLGLALVTNNEADFADIPGLKIENWTL